MTTPTITQPYLGRCKEEGCDYALFAAPEDLQSAEDFKAVTAGTGAYRVRNSGVFARCPQRHKVFSLHRVKGKFNPNHKCDARCLNAKGHDCTCSCGGANHGRGYAVEVQTVQAPTVQAPAITPEEADRKQGHVTAESASATEAQLKYIKTLAEELGILIPYDSTPTREGASKLINDLKARVIEQRQVIHPAEAATPRQLSFINTLMEERSMSLEDRQTARRQFDAGLTRALASRWIERLKELPKNA